MFDYIKYGVGLVFVIGVILVIIITGTLNSSTSPEQTRHGAEDFYNRQNESPTTTASSSTEELSTEDVSPSHTTTANFDRSFTERFDTNYVVKEDGRMGASNSADWWVSSGGYFYSKNGVGSTIIGNLPADDERYLAHAASNPRDTDNGSHPQNIFRLVLRSIWSDSQQEAYFKVISDNLSTSQYRNGSNGLLFFSRYQDEFNLYYTGIRVDGYATIKKKIDGIYYTLAYEPLNFFTQEYDRDINPNMLPKQQWIGMKSVIKTNSDGTVSIGLFVDRTATGDWFLVAEAVDDGKSFGGSAFDEGYAGIRTDFMDVQFDNYSIQSVD